MKIEKTALYYNIISLSPFPLKVMRALALIQLVLFMNLRLAIGFYLDNLEGRLVLQSYLHSFLLHGGQN